MKQKHVFLLTFLAGFILFSNQSCDLVKSKEENKSPCGKRLLSGLAGRGMDNYAYTNFIVNGNASVSWRVNCQNVCTAVHSTPSISLSISNAPGITAKAIILYGYGRERPITLNKTIDRFGNYEFEGFEDFGIKDYYGESPGEFTLLLTMSFPSYNSTWSADSMFVVNNVIDYSMDVFYSTN